MRLFNIKFRFVVIILLSILLNASCTMQKRHYVKGFYFNKITKHKNTKTDSITKCETITLTASTTNEIVLPIHNSVDEHLLFNSNTNNTLCDTIILKNGVRMLAKVISAGQEKIIYKSCENNKDEMLNMESANVASVHYANGNKTDLNGAPNDNPNDFNKPPKPYNNSNNAEADKGVEQLRKATNFFNFSRFFGFGMFIGFIFATLAKNNLKDKPGYEEAYKQARFLSILGLVLGLIILIPIIFIVVKSLI